MNIILTDNVLTGHHKIYQENLSKVEGTIVKNKLMMFTSIKKNIIKGYYDRRIFIKTIVKGFNKGTIIHFLYIDNLYKCPFIAYLMDDKKFKFIGTLHWLPTSRINIMFLKSFSKKMRYIIVHSEYLKKKLEEIGVLNVKYIDYPSFIENQEYSVEKKNEKIIISCLGGTRLDKGLDILIQSFKYIEDNMKQNIIFNIAGIEQDIKFKDIEKEANQNNIEIILNNNFLSDEEYLMEIKRSDVILLPYKKIFSGNSGPMTDGIKMNKFIVGPQDGNIGYLINKHNLGKTFIQEDPIDLASVLSALPKLYLNKDHKYKEDITIEKFIKSHNDLYRSLNEKILNN